MKNSVNFESNLIERIKVAPVKNVGIFRKPTDPEAPCISYLTLEELKEKEDAVIESEVKKHFDKQLILIEV